MDAADGPSRVSLRHGSRAEGTVHDRIALYLRLKRRRAFVPRGLACSPRGQSEWVDDFTSQSRQKTASQRAHRRCWDPQGESEGARYVSTWYCTCTVPSADVPSSFALALRIPATSVCSLACCLLPALGGEVVHPLALTTRRTGQATRHKGTPSLEPEVQCDAVVYGPFSTRAVAERNPGRTIGCIHQFSSPKHLRPGIRRIPWLQWSSVGRAHRRKGSSRERYRGRSQNAGAWEWKWQWQRRFLGRFFRYSSLDWSLIDSPRPPANPEQSWWT